MPQERENQFPHVTKAEWEAIKAEHDPAQTAARAVVARHVTGVPRRAFLTGDNDHSVVMRGVLDLTAAVLDVLNHHPESPAYVQCVERVRDIMENPDGLQD